MSNNSLSQKPVCFGLICFNEGQDAFLNYARSMGPLMLFSIFFWCAAFALSKKIFESHVIFLGVVVALGVLFPLIVGWVHAVRPLVAIYTEVTLRNHKRIRSFCEMVLMACMVMSHVALMYIVPLLNADQMMTQLQNLQQVKTLAPKK